MLLILLHSIKNILNNFIDLGCAKSWQAYVIYKKNELRNTKLIKFVCGFMLFFTVVLSTTAGISPIVFLLLGMPDPDNWILSLPTK